MEFTQEQTKVLDSFKESKANNILVQARAGSGKTTTTIELAKCIIKHSPVAKILYLVYNKAMQEEAKLKYKDIPNVTVLTAHSFAHRIWTRTIGKFEATNKLAFGEIKHVVFNHPNTKLKYSKHRIYHQLEADWTLTTWDLDYFCKIMTERCINESASYNIETRYGIDKEYGYRLQNGCIINAEHIKVFKQIVNNCIHNRKYTHNMYLKFVANLKELPNFGFSVIMFDEAQDANKHMLTIVNKLPAIKKYYIGDDRQAIYKFNGCVNAFDEIEGDKYTLSQSFRFNQDIANMVYKICGIKIVGTPQKNKVIDKQNKTILMRTNAGILETAIDIVSKYDNGNVHIDYMNNLVINSKSLKYSQYDALDFYYHMLIEDDKEQEADQLVQLFDIQIDDSYINETFKQLYNYQKDVGYRKSLRACFVILKGSLSDEATKYFNIYEKCGSEIVDIFYKLLYAENHSADINILLCTAHKSKGLEWDCVKIGNDFSLVDDQNKKTRCFNDEMNLIYVATTRGRYYIDATNLHRQLYAVGIEVDIKDLVVDTCSNKRVVA